MKTLPADLEALMPEPVKAFRDKGTFTLEEKFFTADQVREAMLAAANLERKAVQAALRHESLMLVRTQHGLRVVKAITNAEAQAIAIGGAK